jgi:hypothetical protein
MPNPESEMGNRSSHPATLANVFAHQAIVQGQTSMPGSEFVHQISQRDVDRLVSCIVVSVMSKVNPNPEAGGNRGDTGGGFTPSVPRGEPPMDPLKGDSKDGSFNKWKPTIGPVLPHHDLAVLATGAAAQRQELSDGAGSKP